jgi:hypothetical protein
MITQHLDSGNDAILAVGIPFDAMVAGWTQITVAATATRAG